MLIDGNLEREVLALCRKAGEAILAVYEGNFSAEEKEDGTPVTEADRAAHEVILAGLNALAPGVPVLSEEGRSFRYAERAGWTDFWLVDPLDGTKEFLKRNGEFTVNVALVTGGSPVWGAVHAPALGLTFWGGPGRGTLRAERGGEGEPIHVARTTPATGVVAVKSRSHPSPDLDGYLRRVTVAREVIAGSSLKFCAVAEGRAHLYARFGPTMEWDTGAGHAVLLGAGGVMATAHGAPFTYNKPDLKNPDFIAACNASYFIA